MALFKRAEDLLEAVKRWDLKSLRAAAEALDKEIKEIKRRPKKYELVMVQDGEIWFPTVFVKIVNYGGKRFVRDILGHDYSRARALTKHEWKVYTAGRVGD